MKYELEESQVQAILRSLRANAVLDLPIQAIIAILDPPPKTALITVHDTLTGSSMGIVVPTCQPQIRNPDDWLMEILNTGPDHHNMDALLEHHIQSRSIDTLNDLAVYIVLEMATQTYLTIHVYWSHVNNHDINSWFYLESGQQIMDEAETEHSILQDHMNHIRRS